MKALWLVAAACLVLDGCAQMNGMMDKNSSSDSSSESTQTKAAAPKSASTTKAADDKAASGIYGNPPAGSPFSKLKIGMSSNRVIDLIGAPTDQRSYITGKAWIPFYFGRDRSRMEYRYKGNGVITFSGGGGFSSVYTIYRVIYNPDESGYEH